MNTPDKLLAKYGNPLDRETFEPKWMKNVFLPDWLLPIFPINAFNSRPVTKIYMHRDFEAPFFKVMRELLDTGLIKELLTYDGCFVIRFQRGSKILSIHSWGLAIDFNAKWNPLGGKVNFSKAFLEVWRRNGWVCGADFGNGRQDGMHFEWTKGL